jgi:hypothetical protein
VHEAKLRRNGHDRAVASDWVPHNGLTLPFLDAEYASVAAVEKRPSLGLVEWQGEAVGRDAVGRVKSGPEGDFSAYERELAEEGRLPVVDAEAAEELGIGGDASPALGDEGGAQEVWRLRGEAEEDLVQ